MRFGVQGFGTFRAAGTDAESVIRGIRAAGYAQVEPCVSFFVIPGMEKTIWPYEDFERYMETIREVGLSVPSCHVFSANLLQDAGRLRDMARRYGIRQFVLKSPKELTDTSLQEASLALRQAADAVEEVGARILLHNEAEDIRTRIAGTTAYEHLLDLCMGRVDAQVDVGWAMAGGEDPVALLWRNRDRVRSVHYKDFAGDREVTIGTGDLDLEGCFQFARAMGVPQIMDQDSFSGDPLEELGPVLQRMAMLGQSRSHSASYLNILDTATGQIRVLRRFDRVIEAPNWIQGEEKLLYNSEGRIWRYDIERDEETPVDTGICTGCNNDHVLSPDGKAFAVSHGGVSEEEGYTSRIYTVPMEGGAAKLITPNTPSYLHGWSPDGKELAYCAFRSVDGKVEVDIYTIPADGSGEEKRITSGGFNDGPEYSPDGRHIWFNSTRSGLMQVYRMRTDGTQVVQMTHTRRNNWFGHVSPDGEKVVFLSYREGDLDPGEHLPNMQVELWLMNSDGTGERRIASLFGGQGSINVNSWASDSRRFAFVSYEIVR